MLQWAADICELEQGVSVKERLPILPIVVTFLFAFGVEAEQKFDLRILHSTNS